jgi:hypothetical protein
VSSPPGSGADVKVPAAVAGGIAAATAVAAGTPNALTSWFGAAGTAATESKKLLPSLTWLQRGREVAAPSPAAAGVLVVVAWETAGSARAAIAAGTASAKAAGSVAALPCGASHPKESKKLDTSLNCLKAGVASTAAAPGRDAVWWPPVKGTLLGAAVLAAAG